MVQGGESQEGNPLESSDLNSAPATQGLKLDNYNYTRLNSGALANHAQTHKALALAAVFLGNPINRGAFGRLPGTFLLFNSVLTTSAEVEVVKQEGKKICLSFWEVTDLRFWSLVQVQLCEIVCLVCKK